MLFQVSLPIVANFKIILSKSDKTSGWGIILLNHNSILIDPTSELREYCNGDNLTEFRSDICLKTPQIYKVGNIKIHHGCYHQKPYLYIVEMDREGILFTMGLKDYGKIVKKLKPVLTLTGDGQVLRQGEAYISSLMS